MISRLFTVAALSLALSGLAACGSDDAGSAADAGTCSYPKDGSGGSATAPSAEPAQSGDVPATLKITTGDVGITLDAGAAPCTVNSFVSLAKQGYFDNSPCHRLTTAGIFVLQCGDPTGTGSGGPGYSFADELKGALALPDAPSGATSSTGDPVKVYSAGTVAMANAGPDTNGSQFFLVYADSTLPPAYAVFGTMTAEGLAAVKKVAADGVATGADDPSDGTPADDVTITGVTVG